MTLYQDMHRRRRRASGENSLVTLHAEANIAITLHKLGDYEEARAINADLLPRFERAAGKDHSGTTLTRSRLVMNLRALGRDEEADEVHGGIPRF
nr:tetratricopeptide repeat protein [Streptomyces lunaelactis]